MGLTWSRPVTAQAHRVAQIRRVIPEAVHDVAVNGADKWADLARKTAPWTDRTTAARSGITGEAQQEGKTSTMYCYHTVEYGPHLEFGTEVMEARPSIVPAMKVIGPQVVEDAQLVVVKLLGAA